MKTEEKLMTLLDIKAKLGNVDIRLTKTSTEYIFSLLDLAYALGKAEESRNIIDILVRKETT